MDIFQNLNTICKTKMDVDLKNFCTLRVGGKGKYACYPKNIYELKKLITFLKNNNIKYFIVGNGSNLAFADSGYGGVIISLVLFNKIKARGHHVICGAGVSLFILNRFLWENGLAGLEWSYGIPASVGGATVMNAGAFGHEMCEFVCRVWAFDGSKTIVLKNIDLGFGYRKSNIMNSNFIITKVEFKLKQGEYGKIKNLCNSNLAWRMATQPYGTKNCGSVFKKVDGVGAGKIIDDLGLKGFGIGDIQISPVHANFFVNVGTASCKNFKDVVSFVKSKVLETFGINLKEEVIFVNDDKNKFIP